MRKEELAGCCVLFVLALAAVLLVAYAFVIPVEVTVDEAALGRLALAAPAAVNGTAALAFNVSLAVAVRNPNWALSVWRTGPLGGELRFRGVPFARGWLAPGGGRRRIRAGGREVCRVSSAGESAGLALGSDGVVELARESAAGVFELELVVVGEIRYQARRRRRRFRASCPLRLALSTATAPAAFARVTCA